MIPFESAFNRGSAWFLRGPGMEFDAGSVWDRIERSLLCDPAAESLKQGNDVLTRGELYAAVRDFPSVISRSDRIGVHVARSFASIVTTLAIWRAQAAYVPLPFEQPAARLAAMAASCEIDLIVTDRQLDIQGYRPLDAILSCGTRLMLYARVGPPLRQPRDPRLCYIAHTSATTGAPKGAMISHAALLHRLATMQQLIAISPQDRVLYKASSVFDVHVWEFVLPLICGCALSIYRQSDVFNLGGVLKIAVADRVTILGLVPSLLQIALRSAHFTSGHALRVLFCGGEAWRGSLASAFYAAMPATTLYNSYGPAETTLAVSNFRVPRSDPNGRIELGAPLGSTVFAVVPNSRIDHSACIEGELWIGGPQVALGYVGGVRADSFVAQEIAGRATRFYATGDIVRLDTATGALHFLFRADAQVKLNGVRLELAEIEAVIGDVPGVSGCAAWVDCATASQLCVAYTTGPGQCIDERRIRDACHAKLPTMALPARFRYLPMLPLKPSGKIDRLALASMFSSVLQRNADAA